jgi:DNA modification methylase
LHADIQTRCRRLGFDNLAPIYWYKIASAAYEAEGNGAGFLGKPYEPNAVVKHDVEYILMERKPGAYRSPDPMTRLLSIIPADKHSIWFRQVWEDVKGESTRHHPAPFPEELAKRLIRMFSFVGDTVLDPFVGTGTTMVAAALAGRNSIGVEIDPEYYRIARDRLNRALPSMSVKRTLESERWVDS